MTTTALYVSTAISRRTDLAVVMLFLALIGLILFSLAIGPYPVTLREIAQTLTTTGLNDARPYADKSWVVIEVIRMPRILGVVMCGMGLAMAGAAMQGVMRNPLVGPEIAGVSAGASFGGVLAIMFGLSLPAVVMLAFGFGLFALSVAFGLARITGRGSMLALVLSGVIIGGFFASLTSVMQYLAGDSKLPSIIFWLMGSFGAMTYEKVFIVGVVTLISGTVLMLLRWRINLLSLGEDDARALGTRVDALRWAVIVFVSLIVAAQVAVSGGVGFVGLVVPHMARMLVGPEHSRLLPVAALLGGLFLLAVDDIARTATGQEIPIGLLTSMIGMPIFAWLFWRLQGRGWARDT
jgi:iron complex transport system permease protein